MRDYDDLRSDQVACIDGLFSMDRAYVVMRMGGGKTATAITTAEELIAGGHVRRGFILAPPLVAATVWPREAAKWGHLKDIKIEPLVGSPAQRLKTLATSDADLFSVSDGVVGWLADYIEALPDDDPLLDLLMYDEPKLKQPRGSIGKALVRISERVKIMWLFSGTPRPNGYTDLFMPTQVLMPGHWDTDFDKWRRRNFMQMDYSGYEWEVHDFRAKQLDEVVGLYMVRAAEPKDARKGTLSSGEEFDVEIDLPIAARKKYKEMERDLIIEVARGHDLDLDDPALIIALSQAVASSKLAQIAQGFAYDAEEEKRAHRIHDAKNEALEYILDAVGGETSLITYGFREDLAQIEKLLKKQRRSYGVLGAGVGMKQKLKSVDDWNEGRLDNLILHPASAGHGVELQFGGRNITHFCPTWSAEQYDQVIKRLDRPGQTEQVYSRMIIARDTVDIVKRNRVEYKMSDQEAFKSMLKELK